MDRAPAKALGSLLIAFVISTACTSAASADDYAVGRSARFLVYEGRLNRLGAAEIRQSIRDNDALAINSTGGDLAAGIDIALAVNEHGGSIHSSGECFDECAAIAAIVADELDVSDGSTLLFTKHSLQKLRSMKADRLIGCVPDEVGDQEYVWFAPQVFSVLGMSGVHIEWVLEPEAREGFERLVAGRTIVWIEHCHVS